MAVSYDMILASATLLLVVPSVVLVTTKLIHRSGFFTDSSEVVNTRYGKRMSHSYSSSLHRIVAFTIFFAVFLLAIILTVFFLDAFVINS